ncbi:hypothetical protein SBOR_7306 [Sclerotinia borealis F-4128]|uniref:peptidyl-tRNA hydrolase n=1 Tax=Sclerotinia borealis (strain F-4128) TaxID=1432307 RepID=W9CCS3_SCLBF|nr:hypothetical protein SBOR_7306 [Sclerotinia borealis F-4128]
MTQIRWITVTGMPLHNHVRVRAQTKTKKLKSSPVPVPVPVPVTATEGKQDSNTILVQSPQTQLQSQVSEQTQLPTPPLSSTSSRSSSPPPIPPLTRKQRRQALLAQSLAFELSISIVPKSTATSTSNSNSESDASKSLSLNTNTTTTNHKNPHPNSNLENSPLVPPLSLPPTMTRLLICSIGNPAPYTNTLHSAGHTILTLLGSTLSLSPFSKSRSHGNGLLSPGTPYTLWKSSSSMNISGSGVHAAWTTFLRESSSSSSPSSTDCKLVVIHDELELAPGRINVKPGSNSPKGHNGLKSIRDALRGQAYTRIGIGIGRPESRDAGVVAGYVLRKMSAEEKRKIEGCVGNVVEELGRLSGE